MAYGFVQGSDNCIFGLNDRDKFISYKPFSLPCSITSLHFHYKRITIVGSSEDLSLTNNYLSGLFGLRDFGSCTSKFTTLIWISIPPSLFIESLCILFSWSAHELELLLKIQKQLTYYAPFPPSVLCLSNIRFPRCRESHKWHIYPWQKHHPSTYYRMTHYHLYYQLARKLKSGNGFQIRLYSIWSCTK